MVQAALPPTAPCAGRPPPSARRGGLETAALRTLRLHKQALVITETVSATGETLSVCRRSLQPDGRMCVDVRKRSRCGVLLVVGAVRGQADLWQEEPE